MFIKRKEYQSLLDQIAKWRDIANTNAECFREIDERFDKLAVEAKEINDLSKKINKNNEELIGKLKEREAMIAFWKNRAEEAEKKNVELALLVNDITDAREEETK